MLFNFLRLLELRIKNNLSLEQVINKLNNKGINIKAVQTISNWESGRTFPDGKEIAALCDVFNVKPMEFFSDKT